MLEQILRLIKNYFIKVVYFGTFTIADGVLQDVDFVKDGQYFKIYKSDLNDGVYKWPKSGLMDEVFDGEIWALSVPKEILTLAEEIEAWMAKYGDIAQSPYSSESFGGYSYSKASGNANSGNSIASSWETAFSSRLSQWRKMRYENKIPRKKYPGGGV